MPALKHYLQFSDFTAAEYNCLLAGAALALGAIRSVRELPKPHAGDEAVGYESAVPAARQLETA